MKMAQRKQKGVCHTRGLANYIKKNLTPKEELWKLKYLFHHAKKKKKKSSKKIL
jgi:hypothetical protein